LSIAVVSLIFVAASLRQQSEIAAVTAEAEKFLTSAYGAEARVVIENFKAKWLSLNSYKDPSIQSELAIGSYLDYWGLARKGQALYDEPFWLVTKSASVTHVRVFEYSPERFKAVAQVVSSINQLTPQGEFTKSLPPYKSCGIYVFVREDGFWKLVEYFDMTNPRDVQRDWEAAPDEVKQTIGDLPTEAIRDCEDYAPK